MPRYLVHIGPHKTGTTYIQARLDAARDRLREAGVVYPTVWRASATVASHRRLFERIRNRELEALQGELAEVTDDADALVILSSEDLQYLDEREVRVLAGVLRTTEVTIVYYCRRWSELLPSCWQERIKHGDDQPLAEFLLPLTAHAHRSTIANYGIVLDRYVGVFGLANVRVVSYSNVVDSQLDLAEHFAATFLPPLPGGLQPGMTTRPNASLSPVDIEMVRLLNALGRRHSGGASATIREWYQQHAGTLDLSQLTAAMSAAVVTLPFSDTSPMLDSLHQRLFQQYRELMVPPVSVNRLFRPRQNDLAFVRQDYLADPAAAMQVAGIYQRFRAASDPALAHVVSEDS
jgi:hypothetical protein